MSLAGDPLGTRGDTNVSSIQEAFIVAMPSKMDVDNESGE